MPTVNYKYEKRQKELDKKKKKAEKSRIKEIRKMSGKLNTLLKLANLSFL